MKILSNLFLCLIVLFLSAAYGMVNPYEKLVSKFTQSVAAQWIVSRAIIASLLTLFVIYVPGIINAVWLDWAGLPTYAESSQLFAYWYWIFSVVCACLSLLMTTKEMKDILTDKILKAIY